MLAFPPAKAGGYQERPLGRLRLNPGTTALALKACAGDRAEALLARLTADRREAVAAELAGLEQEDAAARLTALRREQLEALEARQLEQWGPLWRRLPAALKTFAWREAVVHDG